VDNVTHALAGVLLADLATAAVTRRTSTPVSPRFRRVATFVGVMAAELPDIDLVYAGPVLGMGKLGYLLHHRGHTHTIVWAILGAWALWWGTRWWWTRRGDPASRRPLDADEARALLVLALVGALSHLLLDWTNSYGVHPFWPIDNRWFYGDAVFIVEPWLWIVSIPALWWGERRPVGRIALAGALLLIIAAMWGLGQVAPPIAAAATLLAVVGMIGHRLLPPMTRLASGVLLWVAATMLFAVSGARARAQVTRTVRDLPLHDIVLNPAPGDPACWRAIVVTSDAVFYRVSTAVVAPWSGTTGSACAARYRSGRMSGDPLVELADASPTVPFDTTLAAVRWGRTWAAPRAELIANAMERCEFAAALRFLRVPIWHEDGAGVIHLSDARFGTGGGFADLDIPPAPIPCSLTSGQVPPWIPPWVPPRADVLSGGG